MRNQESGFTLIEVILSAGILAVVITGLMRLFIYTSVAAEVAGNKTMAVSIAQSKIEEIRNQSFDTIAGTYNGNVFTPTILTGKGFVKIDSTTATRLIVTVTVCWRDKYNRTIGEDTNLDGVLDLATEDLNGNGQVDSVVQLATMLSKRQ